MKVSTLLQFIQKVSKIRIIDLKNPYFILIPTFISSSKKLRRFEVECNYVSFFKDCARFHGVINFLIQFLTTTSKLPDLVSPT